jgi:hypothetical protein
MTRPDFRLHGAASCLLIGLLFGLADVSVAEEPPNVTDERMVVEGDTLILNTDVFRGSNTQSARITYDDDNLFGDMVMNHPDVTQVLVQGSGGSSKAAEGIVRKII